MEEVDSATISPFPRIKKLLSKATKRQRPLQECCQAKAIGTTMGFLNPFIYKNPQAFNDVEHGVNNGGGPHGFTAVKGWDAATGYGTPNFPKLKEAALKAFANQEQTVVV